MVWAATRTGGRPLSGNVPFSQVKQRVNREEDRRILIEWLPTCCASPIPRLAIVLLCFPNRRMGPEMVGEQWGGLGCLANLVTTGHL